MNSFLRYGEYIAFYLFASLLLWAPYKLSYIVLNKYGGIIIKMSYIHLVLLTLIASIVCSALFSFFALIISTLNQFHAKGRVNLIVAIFAIALMHGFALLEYFSLLKYTYAYTKLFALFGALTSGLCYITFRTYKFLDFHDNYVDASLWRIQKRSD